MYRSATFIVAGVVLAFGAARMQAEDLGTEIDLTGFNELNRMSSVEDDLPLQEVAREFGTAPRRFYASGMIGPSFANLTSPGNAAIAGDGSIFNAGGALGIAFERQNGRLRIETEGMGRSTYLAPCPEPSPCSTLLTNNWSVMENAWRDLMITDRFGVYGGGGIGAGGYIFGERAGDVTLYEPPGANFAWQFGGGLLWELGDRLTFDVGYRYFQIDPISHANVSPTLFAANELMFTLRLYEPFRGWRR